MVALLARRMPIHGIILKVTICALVMAATASSQGFSWVHEYENCAIGSVYDTAGLMCSPCHSNDTSRWDCGCQSGYRRAFLSSDYDGSTFGTCQQCDSASSFDGHRCVQCDTSSGTNHRPATLVDGQCQCADNTDELGLITERDVDGSLIRAANGTYLQRCIVCSAKAEAGSTSCSFCDYPKVINSRSQCVCPTALPADVRCSDEEPLKRVLDSLRLGSTTTPYEGAPPAESSTAARSSQGLVRIPISAALKDNLEVAVIGCHDTGTPQSCNAVSNLCVLQLYSRDSVACNVYDELARIRNRDLYRPDEVLQAIGWTKSLPWLYYPSGISTTALETDDVSTELQFRGGSLESRSVSRLTFVLATYTLTGSYLGLFPLELQTQVCGNKLARGGLWANVGTDFTNECTIDVLDLMWSAQQGSNETLLYDLYYVDGMQAASVASLQSVSLQEQQFEGLPVLFPVPLIIDNIQLSDRQEEAQLTRRFFMIDTKLGRAAEEDTPAWVQYASSVRLVIQMSEEARYKIRPPRLYLQYSAVPVPSEGEDLQRRPAKFEVQYLNSAAVTAEFWEAWEVCMGIFLSLGFAIGFLRALKWKERRRGSGADGEYEFLLQLLGELGLCVGLGLAAVAMVISLHSFVVFQGQKSSFLYAIPNDELGDFRLTVILSAFGLGLSVAHMVYVQTQVTDVALVDWERPQQVINEDGQHVEGAVSCWRSIFIANAFSKLSTARRANPTVSFIVLILLLEGVGWKTAAYMASQGGAECPDELHRSDLLAMGSAAGTLLLIVICQVVLRAVLTSLRLPGYGNWEDPRYSFMDQLYFCNTSLFIMDEAMAGFYLDGKFMEPRSDDTLQRLAYNLEKQAAGSITRHTEAELVFLGADLHAAYATKRAHLRGAGATAAAAAQAQSLLLVLKRALEAAPAVVTPTLWQTWTRDVSVREAADASGRKPVRARDAYNLWSSVIFYGQEVRLVGFEVMLLCALDLGVRNTTAAACAAWIASVCVSLARRQLGRHSLARGALVDKRFLT